MSDANGGDQPGFDFDAGSSTTSGNANDNALTEPHLTPDNAEATQLFNDLLALHGGNPTLALVHACEVLAQLSASASAGYSRGPIIARHAARTDGTP